MNEADREAIDRQKAFFRGLMSKSRATGLSASIPLPLDLYLLDHGAIASWRPSSTIFGFGYTKDVDRAQVIKLMAAFEVYLERMEEVEELQAGQKELA